MQLAKINKCVIELLAADVANVPADALIAPLHSTGEWIGGINAAIRKCAGNSFHAQARDRMPFSDGDAFIAKRGEIRGGMFRDVLFVCDDWKRPLAGIVREALWRATDQEIGSVILPAMRTGAAFGQFEKTSAKAVLGLVTGVKQYLLNQPTESLKRIRIVVQPDSPLYEQLSMSF